MITIGYKVASRELDYNKALASSRIRALDLINYFRGNEEVSAEVYRDNKTYDIIVFQKVFDSGAFKLAVRERAKGSKIVFDIGTNYLSLDNQCVSGKQIEDCKKFLQVTDAVSVSSPYLEECYKNYHDMVVCIDDAVEDKFLGYNKRVKDDNLKLVYCGYANKANEVYEIESVLIELYHEYKITLLYISDKDPGDIIAGVPYSFIKFDYSKLPSQLVQGDIKISPRDLNREYNRGHSVLKIAYPMSVGLPVVASPIPSYLPYLDKGYICSNNEEWYNSLRKLIADKKTREEEGKNNKQVVSDWLILSHIGMRWKEFFKGLI